MRHSYRKYQELQYSVPTADLLLVLFVALKLTGVIDWSWWWVLSPIWIMFSLAVLVFAGAYIYVAVKSIIKKRKAIKKKA